MDTFSETTSQILGLLLLGAPLGLMTERTIHIAMVKSDGSIHRGDKLSQWIWQDSVVFIATIVVSMTVLLPSAVIYGPEDVSAALATARDNLSWFGWAITAVTLLHLISPFWVGTYLLIGRSRRAR